MRCVLYCQKFENGLKDRMLYLENQFDLEVFMNKEY